MIHARRHIIAFISVEVISCYTITVEVCLDHLITKYRLQAYIPYPILQSYALTIIVKRDLLLIVQK